MSEFVDRTLICVGCRQPFKFSAGEQEFFKEKLLLNEPKRCKPCKQAKEVAIRAREETRGQRIQTEVVCAECGAQTTVPFVPSEGRPVYCKPCFDKRSQ